MSLKPYIDGDLVKKIEVSGRVIPARNDGVPLSELPQIVDAFNVLTKHFDFEAIGKVEDEAKEWSSEEIWDFLNERNERQLLFFRILTEHEEITIEDLLEKMVDELEDPNFDGRKLAGALGGIGIRTNSLKKEALYKSYWREEDKDWMYYYALSPSYAPIVKEWFEEEDEE